MTPGCCNTDKSFLFFEFEAGFNMAKKFSTLPQNFAQTILPGFRSSVPAQLTAVNRVDIPTLTRNAGKILEGKYFLCRTLAPSIRMTAVRTVVEDPSGQYGIRLALYNYSTSDRWKPDDLLQDLPVAQILAIRNPWFKSALDGGFVVECDNPADVFLMSELLSQELFPGVKWEGEIPRKWQKWIKSPPQSAIEWKNEGNKLFVDKKYQKAIQCYTEGLFLNNIAGTGSGVQVALTVTCDMLSNRAAAYLNMDCFRNALGDVNKLLEIDPIHIKGLYRKGKTLLGLQRLEEAIVFLESVQNLESLDSRNQKLFSELLKLTKIMLKQQKTGEYDILKLFNEGAVRHDDYADYVGPVKVQKIDGRGRGLVAAQDIEPGQLISATKALVVVFPEKVGVDQHVESKFNINNFESNFAKTVSQERKLVEGIAQKLTLEPSLCPEVYELYAGPDIPIYDKVIEKGDGAHVVDMKRIGAICTFNSFGGSMTMDTDKSEHEVLNANGTPIHSCGVWVFPSFFNHSCYDSNALWTTYGDMLFVRAFEKIPQGEEILIPYMDPMELYENRVKLMKNHGFVCECRLCQIDRDDSVEGRKRMELLGKIDKYFRKIYKNTIGRSLFDKQKDFDFMMTCYKNIMDLDKEGQKPNLKMNPSFAYPLIELAQYYFNPKRPELSKVVNLLTKCHNMTINSPLKDFAIECSVNLIVAHLMMGNVKEAKKWTDTLKKEILNFHGSLDMIKVIARSEMVDLMEKYNIPFHCFNFLSTELGFCDGDQ